MWIFTVHIPHINHFDQDFFDQALTRSLTEYYPFARFAAEFWYYHYHLVDMNSAKALEGWGLKLL